MTGDQTLTYPLTDEEKALVERAHGLIWKVMWDMRLPYAMRDNLYDIGALALMRTARKYQTRNELQKYAFTTIAYRKLKNAYIKNIKAEKKFEAKSLDAEINDNGSTLRDIIPAQDYVPENLEETLEAHRRVRELLSEKEFMCIELCALGLSSYEIEQYHGISRGTYTKIIWRVKEKCFARYGEIFNTTETAELPKKRKLQRITEEESAEIIRLFNEGMSTVQIGRILERNHSSISYHIKKISVRRQPERKNKRVIYT